MVGIFLCVVWGVCFAFTVLGWMILGWKELVGAAAASLFWIIYIIAEIAEREAGFNLFALKIPSKAKKSGTEREG